MSRDDLASQLKIERDQPTRRRRRGEGGGRWGLIIGMAAVAIVAAAGVIWFLIARPDLTEVETAEAKAAWSGAAQSSTLLDASGYVVARREATVSAKVAGKVQQVMIEEGQHVAAGQVMATIDDSNARAALAQSMAQAASAQASIGVAEATLEGAQSKYNRSRGVPPGILSAQMVEDDRTAFDTARENLALAKRQAASAQATVEVYRRSEDDTVVRAPFAGVVTATAAQPGEIVAPVAGGGFTRTGICTIVDMDSLEVEVDVAESFISRVTPGMPASVKLNAYPDWEIPAQVITVIPTADRSKATVTVRVGFKVRDPRIVPEMGAHVAFLSPAPAQTASAAAPRTVIVPPDAVQTEDGGQAVVFVIADGHAERRAVRLGDRNTQGQIVVAGLAPGETVAVEGADKLKDGASVKIAKNKTD
ncbi:MAG TPA: efflux RND transporter periplasmic adaptor subunit [Caulobacteraceae bacterium]|nr:efflux RND transporter periplasmic adaptor subunit [Caulobacteraceae bacterium]